MFKAGYFAYSHSKHIVSHILRASCVFTFTVANFPHGTFTSDSLYRQHPFLYPSCNIENGAKTDAKHLVYLLVTCFPIFVIQFSFIQNQSLNAF